MHLIDNKQVTHYILLLSCQDRPGIVHEITSALLDLNANIVQADQHSTDDQQGVFFMRIEFVFFGANQALQPMVDHLKSSLMATVQWHDLATPMACSILVSKEDHCLQELLYQWKSKGLNIAIESIISNHNDHKALADWYELPFHFIPSDSKHVSEEEIIRKTQSTDMLIMARYMQILSADFLSRYHRPVVNIHHSFLPSFSGAKPYHQAFARGVKLIGATAHYATEELDNGPIIVQNVSPVSHRHTIDDLKQLGVQLEKQCLLDAIRAISEHRVMIHESKTIVF